MTTISQADWERALTVTFPQSQADPLRHVELVRAYLTGGRSTEELIRLGKQRRHEAPIANGGRS